MVADMDVDVAADMDDGGPCISEPISNDHFGPTNYSFQTIFRIQPILKIWSIFKIHPFSKFRSFLKLSPFSECDPFLKFGSFLIFDIFSKFN
jgi:hypothetical protein